MKAYTFTVAPVICEMFVPLGYDCAKIGNAVEAHGNDTLKIEDTSAKSGNRYTPQRSTARAVKPAQSNATATTTIRFVGDGSAPRQFAAWHDDAVKMVAKYGALVACPLPVSIKTWLDAKFKTGAKAPGKSKAPAARGMTPAAVGSTNGSTGNVSELVAPVK